MGNTSILCSPAGNLGGISPVRTSNTPQLAIKRKEGIIMQNIINFENIISSKKVSVNLINELIGYAEDEKNIPAIRKAVAAVRNGKILPTSSESEQKKNNRTENWYKSHYNTFKAKNEKHLRNALTALRETGLTNPEITQKTGYFKVNELIGATPKPLLVARRERINAERREKMLALRKQGMNKTQIAKALGVSTAMVNKILEKYTDEERKEIQRQTMQHCLETRKISGKFRGTEHWMHAAKEDRVRTLGPMVDKMQKAGIPYRKIEVALGYGEDTLRMYRKQYLASVHRGS